MTLTAPLRAALPALLLLLSADGAAQIGGSIALDSDYRYRGVSLSEGRPSLSLGLGYDSSAGWFAGAALASVQLESQGRQVQVLGYAGRAGRLGESLSWETGLTVAHFTREAQYDYRELFGGVSGERWSLRVHYAPDYFGSGARTLYCELNAGLPLIRSMRLIGHLGALSRLAGDDASDADRRRWDARLGISIVEQATELQLNWTAGSRSGLYPVSYGHERGAVVLTISHGI